MTPLAYASTDMAHAIAFISAVLQEPFTAATSCSAGWTALATSDGGIVVLLEQQETHLEISLNFAAARQDHDARTRLFSILGWGSYYGHRLVFD